MPNTPHRWQPLDLPETSQEDEIRSATKAIFELLSDHEKRIDAMTLHGHTVAQQVAELTTGMRELRDEIPQLMAQGFATAVSDPETWAAGRKAMQQAARDAAGGWVFNMAGGLFKQVMWSGLILFVAYKTGGLPALLALLNLKSTP